MGAVLLPALVTLGAIAALAANYTLVIEKETVPGSVAPRTAIGGQL